LVSAANILDNIGQIEKGNALMERAGGIARTMGEQEPLAFVMYHGMETLRRASTRKDPWGAIEHGRASFTAARAAGHPRLMGVTQAYMGMNFWLLGAGAEAENIFADISLPEEELGYGLSRRHFSTAWLLADRGAFDDAKRWARRLIDAGVTRKVNVFEGLGRWVMAEIHRRAGERGAAEMEITAALDLLDASAKLERPGALASLAAVRLAQGRATEALTIVNDAVAQASAMGACSRFFRDAFLALTHAECLEATGDVAGTRAALANAQQWILEVANRIGDPAYRRLYLEEVPENRRILELCLMHLPS
jgi:eukaryotic-like serine/threonine-protein kinase